MRLASILFLFVVAAATALGQAVRVEGDPSIRRALEEQSRKFYESPKQQVYLLVRSDTPGLRGYRNAEITGSYVAGDLARIVITAWNDRGKCGIEYYIHSGVLLNTYETFEFFSDTAPDGAWKNFRVNPAWERRAYFRNGEAGYVETTGAGAPGLDAALLLSSINRLRLLLEEAKAHR